MHPISGYDVVCFVVLFSPSLQVATSLLSVDTTTSEITADLKQLKDVLELEQGFLDNIPGGSSLSGALDSAKDKIPGGSAASGLLDQAKDKVPGASAVSGLVDQAKDKIPGASAASGLLDQAKDKIPGASGLLDQAKDKIPGASGLLDQAKDKIPGASSVGGLLDKAKDNIPGASMLGGMVDTAKNKFASLFGGLDQISHITDADAKVEFCDIKVTCWQGGNDDDGVDADPRKLAMHYHPDKAGGKPLEVGEVSMSLYEPIPQHKMLRMINHCTDIYKQSLLNGGCGLSKEEKEQLKSLSLNNNDIYRVNLYAQGPSVQGQLESKDGIGQQVRWNQRMINRETNATVLDLNQAEEVPCGFTLMIKMDVKNDWKTSEPYKPKVPMTDYQSGVTVDTTERYEIMGRGSCVPELLADHLEGVSAKQCQAECDAKESCVGYEFSPAEGGNCKLRKKGVGRSTIFSSTRDGTSRCFRKKQITYGV